MWETIIPAAGKVIGTFFDNRRADQTLKFQQQEAAAERQRQADFAQHGVQWRVEDAQRAGIHPLAALGVSGASSSPITVGTVDRPSMADTLGGMGQDISRAVRSTATAPQRAADEKMAALNLEKAGLENDILRSRLAKERGQMGPSMPSLTGKQVIKGQGDTELVPLAADVKEANPVVVNSQRVKHTREGSPAQEMEDWYGDLLENIYGIQNWYADMYASGKFPKHWDSSINEMVKNPFAKFSASLVPGSWLARLRDDIRARNSRRY